MLSNQAVSAVPAVKPKKKHPQLRKFWKSRELLLLFIPGLLYYAIFRYAPMYGLVISFQKFSPFLGVFKSPFVGFHNFEAVFLNPYFLTLLKNTLLIGIYTMIWEFPMPILFAILLNECRAPRLKKGVQSISFLPSFLSTVIICSFAIDLLSPGNGAINAIIKALGHEPIFFMIRPEWFRTIYVATGVWAGIGSGSIVYLAALAGVDQQLYEAADIDGCGRLKKIWYITIPSILPTVVTMLILNCGRVINVGAEKILVLYNAATMDVADVLNTYVYRYGLQGGNFAVGTAVGLFNSIVALILLFATNYISRKLTDTGIW